MRILAFSDLHCGAAEAAALVEAADAADLVIGAGDFATQHRGLANTMDRLRPLEDRAVWVPGNNETPEALRGVSSAPVLHGGTLERGGVTIAGIGAAVPPLPSPPWPSYDLLEDEAEALLAGIDAADILISHSPPHGIADTLPGIGHCGSYAVRRAVERLAPRLVFCGHIHDCWGQSGRIGGARVVNLGPGVNWFEI